MKHELYERGARYSKTFQCFRIFSSSRFDDCISSPGTFSCGRQTPTPSFQQTFRVTSLEYSKYFGLIQTRKLAKMIGLAQVRMVETLFPLETLPLHNVILFSSCSCSLFPLLAFDTLPLDIDRGS